MCVLHRKIVLFDDFVNALCRWTPENGGPAQVDLNIDQLTSKKLMKLLYFTCLMSVEENDPNQGIGLFQVFDNFKAYEYGPVEESIYNALSNLVRFTMSNGKICRCDDVVGGDDAFNNIMNREADQFPDRIFNLLHNAINELMNNADGIIEDSVDLLVKISHDAYLWQIALSDVNGSLTTNNHNALLREKQRVLELLGRR